MATTASLDSKQTAIAEEPRVQDEAVVKAKPGAWKDDAAEIHVIPKNNMTIVFSGLMCCVFLAALDQVCFENCRPIEF